MNFQRVTTLIQRTLSLSNHFRQVVMQRVMHRSSTVTPHSLRFRVTKKILQLINKIGICLNFLRLDLKLEWNLQLEPSRESQPIILFFLHPTT